jgi:hypothetical protein
MSDEPVKKKPVQYIKAYEPVKPADTKTIKKWNTWGTVFVWLAMGGLVVGFLVGGTIGYIKEKDIPEYVQVCVDETAVDMGEGYDMVCNHWETESQKQNPVSLIFVKGLVGALIGLGVVGILILPIDSYINHRFMNS